MQNAFTQEDWFNLSTYEQLAYIGEDVENAINARKNSNIERCNNMIQKVLASLELTMADPKTQYRSREIIKIKLLLLDDFYGENEYQSTDNGWIKYFACFKHLANIQEKGK